MTPFIPPQSADALRSHLKSIVGPTVPMAAPFPDDNSDRAGAVPLTSERITAIHHAIGKGCADFSELVSSEEFVWLLEVGRKENPQPKDEAELARLFHDTYERLAPSFGYETRVDTKQFDPSSPNGRLMVAVCSEVMRSLERRLTLAMRLHAIEVKALKGENADLSRWKQEALQVMPDFQAIGKELGTTIGTDVSSQILPKIKELKHSHEQSLKFLRDQNTAVLRELAETRRRMAFAEDAAKKGDNARLEASGMEMEIAELKKDKETERSLREKAEQECIANIELRKGAEKNREGWEKRAEKAEARVAELESALERMKSDQRQISDEEGLRALLDEFNIIIYQALYTPAEKPARAVEAHEDDDRPPVNSDD